MFNRPRNITHNILIGIAVILALLAGVSIMAWLLPTTFNSFGDSLIRITGNLDIELNVRRIGNDPISYSIIFSILALGVRWLAGKF
jgi:hypothetical protein